MRRASIVALALVLLLAGCECGGGAGGGGGGTVSEHHDERPMGTIEGVVRLADGAELPGWPESPVVVEGRDLAEGCTPPREVDRTPVTIADETGGLVGLSITGTGPDESDWPAQDEPVTHDVVIRDCRLTPGTIVATRGDRLRVRTEGGVPFFPDLGQGMLQFRSEGHEIALDRGGVRTIECGWGSPCGKLVLITLYHPVHTVTEESGRFRLEVPAGQDVRITAWHPLFEEAFTMARVEPGETREVEITIRPARLATPPPPGGEGGSEGGDVPPPDVAPDPNVPF